MIKFFRIFLPSSVIFDSGGNKKDQHKMLVKIKRLEGTVFFPDNQPSIVLMAGFMLRKEEVSALPLS